MNSSTIAARMVLLLSLQLTVETGCVTMPSLVLHHMEKLHPLCNLCRVLLWNLRIVPHEGRSKPQSQTQTCC